ncbi:right-handed parallel beta-helix repeat-containing protein [Maritimibacter dapengensis]|uniref:Right-handed parallel beta-helix repeat-containing protein n=1 Tax=Maritimibacter dapengensis TaxID=2836868 RepID=A0ABS6T3J1_9RHOB|nr:right-handed parallel beta-helix repeat-containing protein [Maritimibacter dapengensis]MBV7379824.1 right-handed parallel beta-helix repeat-containing protein [Maritimibacter dapengensis]
MTVFNVSSASELTAALNNASGGDEIRLAGGSYGDFSFSDKNFGSEVTITSQSGSDPAVFNTVDLHEVSYLTLDDIVVDFTPDRNTTDHFGALTVKDSSNITISNSVFDGGVSVDEGEYTARGMFFFDTTDIVITNNDVYNFRRGIHTVSVDTVEISYNHVHDNRTTVVGGSDATNVTIVGNHLSSSHPVDFGGSGDHGDFIHFWNKKSQDGPSENFVIENNFIEQGSGTALLGIFLEGGYGVGFEDVVINNNVIHNGNGTGMRLTSVDGLVVSNNTLIGTDTESRNLPRIRLEDDTQNVKLIDNVVFSETVGEAVDDAAGRNISETGTIIVQRDSPMEPNYIGDLYRNGLVMNGDLEDFIPKSGSIVDGVGATLTSDQIAGGSDTSWQADEGDSTGSETDSGSDDTGEDTTTDQGSAGGTNGGEATDEDDAGSDGGSEEAGAGSETGSNNGSETDTETDTGDDQSEQADEDESDSGSVGGSLEDAETFLNQFDDYVFDIAAGLNDNPQVDRVKGDTHVALDGSELCVVFDGDGDSLKLGRIEQFEESEQIAVSVEFTRDEADGSLQRLVWNHQKIGIAVNDDGLRLRIGDERISIDDIGLNDTETHRITMIVDQESDHLQVLVDDAIVLDQTDTDLDFVGNGGREWGWMLGTPWSADVDGVISDFRIDDDIAFVEEGSFADATMFG